MWPAWRESSMRFFSGSISSGKTAPSLFLHKQLDVTAVCRSIRKFPSDDRLSPGGRAPAMVAWLLVLHVFGFTLWISGLLMTTLVLLRHIGESAPEARAGLAGIEKLGLRAMADPGALLAILAGILLITTNSSYYL